MMNFSQSGDPNASYSSEDISRLSSSDIEYDYLSKIIIIGPSGVGKSCILHRFIRGDWNVLASQTIGVEFSSKIISIGPSPSPNNINMKLQLWDTAGQERFRSLTRSYYRGSAGVVLVYDVTNKKSFEALHEFMADIQSLTNDTISIAVVGNKADLVSKDGNNGRKNSSSGGNDGPIDPTTVVSDEEVLEFCAYYSREIGYEIPFIKASALLADNINYIFDKLSNMILTKVEIGVIDPEDPLSGVQYGDLSKWDIQSTSSEIANNNNGGQLLRKKPTTISLLNRRATRYTGNSAGSGWGWVCC
ncbi:hypothetical protein DASC09_011540 [Saccharomycopsis crataegensis]|uniref:Uncharacterized protein n=1 Tax=Saccharomycopsis crataegensis TaxID=43959 RepID=A0AAV5QGN2_9ASCO|nr:hypothetical protein DASC09_011540 [Saccharomycopsis crataegensis]